MTDNQVVSAVSTAQVEQNSVVKTPVVIPSGTRTAKRPRAGVASIVGVLIGVMLPPLLDHKNAIPTILTYSFDYVVLLVLLAVVAVVLAQLLAFLVRGAQTRMQGMLHP